MFFKFFLLALSIHAIHPEPLNYAVFNAEPDFGYRLPNFTKPIRYEIEVTTHIHHRDERERYKFEGVVRIRLKPQEICKRIDLHQRQLTIESAKLWQTETNEPLQTWTHDQIPYNEVTEIMAFHTDFLLSFEDEYILEIRYNGTLRGENMDHHGFYRSSYVDTDGSQRWLAVTQFEPTDARHAFPCYDEPGVRAVYSITIIHGSGYTAVSNAAVLSKDPYTAPGYTKTRFHDTPNMQTYILAWVITDFTFIEAHSDGIPQRVWARRQAIENGLGDFALQVGVKIHSALDTYVGLNYSATHTKMDHIAIPDLWFGAMENWGLITYRENEFLYDPKLSTAAEKHKTAELVTHEYTHQYFGNLVAPAWWNFVWLNEGFATLYENLLLTSVYPDEFKGNEDMFQLKQLQDVMVVDGYGVTRAMSYYVETPRELEGLFDDIAYAKSGSVLRTLMNAIGESTWRKGIHYYLVDMRFRSATPDDLSRNLQKAVDEDGVDLSGLSMKQIIDNWSLTPGFPVVHVSINEAGKITFKQSSFMYFGTRDSSLWYIPIEIEGLTNFWLTTEELTLESTDFIPIVNPKQTGYFRVNYDETIWERIIKTLEVNHESIHHATRAGLLNDAFNLARADLLPYSTAFRLSEYLHREIHFVPWVSINVDLQYIDHLLRGTPAHEWFNRYIQQLISGIYDRQGLRDLGDSEAWGDKKLRDVAIKWACGSGHSNCRDEMKNLVLRSVQGQEFPPDLQSVVYCTGCRSLTQENFIKIWMKQDESPDEGFRTRVLEGLGCNENVDNQKFLLDSTLRDESRYSEREETSVITSVYSNGGLDAAIEFLTGNAKAVDIKYGKLATFASEIAKLISSEELFEQYRTLLSALKREEIIDESDEEKFIVVAENNLKWLEANYEEIFSYFRNVFSPIATNGVSKVFSGVFVIILAVCAWYLLE